MGPKSAGEESGADLRLQAAARLIPFWLIRRLKMAGHSYTPRSAPVVARRRLPGLRPVLFAVGLWCLPVGGASNTNSLEFETRPLEQGSIQWDINRSAAQELQ